MPERPPRLADRFLEWALGPSDSARSVRGDLNEDFVRLLRARGRRVAHRWFWREALSLGATALLRRLLRLPFLPDRSDGDPTVKTSPGASGVLQDLHYALRAVRRDPGFFVFATLIIGLGIGASTAVFSVMSPLLVQPLPFHEPERLVLVENSGTGSLSAVTSRTSNLRDFRERSRSFAGLGGYNAFFEQGSYNLVGSGEPERIMGVEVTNDLLEVLGVAPQIGRNFTYEEGLWGGPAAVILTHGFWVRRFAADPGVVGSSITLNDQPRQVVGVLPPSFDFSSVFTPAVPVDFLLPWPISDETDRRGNTTTIVGRLGPGATIDAAQSELEAILTGLAEADPDRWGLGATTSGLQERIARPFRAGMLLLGAAAGLVMLIVCVNLSNMLLARSPRRRREMAVRKTLGATRPRLVRQLLAESVIVSMCGAALGLVVAFAATRFVAGTQGLEIPMLSTVGIDGTALLFTAAIALVAGVAVGAVPAIQVAEGGEAEALRGSSRGSSVGRGGRRLRELLVVSEVAMACVLLVLGGLVLRSFQRVMDVELGFEPENAVAWRLSTTRPFESLPEAAAFYDQVVAAVEAVPGVEAVGLVDALPLGRQRTWGTRVVGVEYRDDTELATGFFPHVVDTRYLSTMGIPLLEGRGFTPDDHRESARVAIVNETAARTMFPNGEAVGRFIAQGGEGGTEIVGVVGDVKHVALDANFGNEVYFPMAQVWDFNTPDLVVRTRLPVETIVAPVRASLRSVDARMPTEDFRTLESIVEVSVSPRRFTLQLLSAFALCALLLAGLGIYGVLSYAVTERIPEIGIRMALGESAAEVRRGVVGKTLALAGIGVAVGSLVALVASRLASSLLYGVEPDDPATFVGMVVVLLAVSILSGLVPAIRASRIDSAGALRSAG
jgi:predicted permease